MPGCPVSGLGMGFFVDVFQFLDAVVRVYLRGRQAAVPEQFFYGVEVGPAVHEMGGKGMAEYVRTFLIDGGHQGQVLFDSIVYISRVELLPARRYQQHHPVALRKDPVLIRHVFPQPAHQGGAHRDHPFFAAFPQYFDGIARSIHLALFQPDQFRLAHTGIVKKFQEQALGLPIPIIREFHVFKQHTNGFIVDKLRQSLFYFGRNNACHGRSGDRFFPEMVFKKRLERRYLPVDGFTFHTRGFELGQPGTHKRSLDLLQIHLAELGDQIGKKGIQVVLVRDEGMLRITLLEFQVIQESPGMCSEGWGHKKTDTQS